MNEVFDAPPIAGVYIEVRFEDDTFVLFTVSPKGTVEMALCDHNFKTPAGRKSAAVEQLKKQGLRVSDTWC